MWQITRELRPVCELENPHGEMWKITMKIGECNWKIHDESQFGLVDGWKTEKHEFVSWDDDSQYMEKQNMFQTTNEPQFANWKITLLCWEINQQSTSMASSSQTAKWPEDIRWWKMALFCCLIPAYVDVTKETIPAYHHPSLPLCLASRMLKWWWPLFKIVQIILDHPSCQLDYSWSSREVLKIQYYIKLHFFCVLDFYCWISAFVQLFSLWFTNYS